jgi:hypothetical protein
MGHEYNVCESYHNSRCCNLRHRTYEDEPFSVEGDIANTFPRHTWAHDQHDGTLSKARNTSSVRREAILSDFLLGTSCCVVCVVDVHGWLVGWHLWTLSRTHHDLDQDSSHDKLAKSRTIAVNGFRIDHLQISQYIQA